MKIKPNGPGRAFCHLDKIRHASDKTRTGFFVRVKKFHAGTISESGCLGSRLSSDTLESTPMNPGPDTKFIPGTSGKPQIAFLGRPQRTLKLQKRAT